MLLAWFTPEIFAQKGISSRSSLGEGIKFTSRKNDYDLSLYGVQQTVYSVESPVNNTTHLYELNHNFNVQMARLGVKGFILEPEFEIHIQYEFAPDPFLLNLSSGNTGYNGLLDAYFDWNLVDNFHLKAGQQFLPGPRGSFVSLKMMEFTRRNELFFYTGLDREVSFQSYYELELGSSIIKPTVSFSGGEGRNSGANRGGLCYIGRLDWYVFGKFENESEEAEGDLERSLRPKLLVGGGYMLNDNAVRENSHMGAFTDVERDIEMYFADILFRYEGFSVNLDYMFKTATIPVVYDTAFNKIAIFNTGVGYGGSVSYTTETLENFAFRYTKVEPTPVTGGHEYGFYNLGFSRHLVSHHIKFQTDFYYKQYVTDLDPEVGLRMGAYIGF